MNGRERFVVVFLLCRFIGLELPLFQKGSLVREHRAFSRYLYTLHLSLCPGSFSLEQ